MTAAVPNFISMEMSGVNMLLGLIAGVRHRALIAMVRMEMIVYMAMEIV